MELGSRLCLSTKYELLFSFLLLFMFPIESLVLLNYPGPLGPWEADVDASWSPFCRRLPGPYH